MGYYIDSCESTIKIKKKDIPNLMNDLGFQNYADLNTALVEEYYIEDDQEYSWNEDNEYFYFLDRFIADSKARFLDDFFPVVAKYVADNPQYMEFTGENGDRWREYLYKGQVKCVSPRIIWPNPFTQEDEEYGD